MAKHGPDNRNNTGEYRLPREAQRIPGSGDRTTGDANRERDRNPIRAMMAHYATETGCQIRAVQATYSNAPSIQAALGDDAEPPRGEPPEVWGFFTARGCLGPGHRVALHPVDWLIKSDEPGYGVLPDDIFKARYAATQRTD